jgi:hypothetical protein
MDALKKTATLLVVLSPNYIASHWCDREKDTFLKIVEEQVRANSRVFVIKRYKLEDDKIPVVFREKGFKFWLQERPGDPPRILGYPRPIPGNPNDQPYYDELNRLSFEMTNELEQMRKIAEAGGSKARTEADPAQAPVFLAEVTDDIDDKRQQVINYLEQQKLRVIPQKLYPREAGEFQAAVDEDLAKCKLFVQLLSAVVGKRPTGAPGSSYARLQYERAISAGKTILQWRSRDLDTKTLPDADHQKLLEGETVLAVGLEEFKQEVLKKATYEPPPAVKRKRAFVFVNREQDDKPITESVLRFLGDNGIDWIGPIDEGKPKEIRKDLESNLRECDGMIIVYGKSSPLWVREQLRQSRKIFARNEKLKAIGIYEGPPEPKKALETGMDVQILNCREGINESALKAFIDNL